MNNRIISLLIGFCYCKWLLKKYRGRWPQATHTVSRNKPCWINEQSHIILSWKLFALRHLAQTFSLDQLCGMCIWTERFIPGTNCVGCTCDRKQFRRITVFFSSTVCISVFERSPVAHDLILTNVCARRAYPRRFLGRVGRTPLSPTLTWRRFQMPSRKGVLNRLFRSSLY